MRNIMIRNRLLSIFLTVAILLTLFGGVSLPATAEDSTDQQSNQNEETSGKTYSYPALFAPEQGKDGFSYYTGVSVDTLQPATYKNNIWVDAAPLNNAGEAFQMAGNGAIVPGNGKIAALGFKVPEDGVLSADVVFDKIGNDDPDISRWENAYANGIILSVIHKKADGQVELYSKEVKTFLFARNMVAFHIPETAVKQGDELLFAFDSNPLSADTGSTGKASNWKDGGYLDLTIYMSESEETLAVGQYDYTNATAHSWPGAWVGDATKVSEVPAKFTQGTGGFSHYITAPRWNSTTWNTFDPIKDNYIYLNDSYLTMSNGVPASNGLTTYIPRYFALGANGYFCPGQWGEYAVISYTAEKDGTLLLDWQITNQPGANQTEIWHMLGYQLHIYKNTEKIYTKPISNTANADVYNINLAVDVKAGDVLYFAVDPDNGEVAGAANGTYDWTGYGIDWSDNGTMDLSILAVEKNPEKPDAPILSTDATLHSLAVSGVTLSPEFDPSELSYAATVNTNTAEITLTASCEAKARRYVNDALTASGNPINVRLAIGANTVKIKVVAEDSANAFLLHLFSDSCETISSQTRIINTLFEVYAVHSILRHNKFPPINFFAWLSMLIDVITFNILIT